MITIDFRRLDLKPGQRVLDIGCGEGRHTASAWEYPGMVCIGADRCHRDLVTSQNKLKFHEAFTEKIKADKRGASSEKNGSPDLRPEESYWALSAADITRLPFGDNSFDTVICSEVMEHIPDEKKALTELQRIIKPGGRLALSVPRYWPEKMCWKLSSQYPNSPGGHIRIYRKKELTDKITGMGLKFHGHHYAHSLHSPFWWLKCATGLEKGNDGNRVVSLYHRLLVWDLMKRPFITRFAEKLMNPLMGKSLVLYFSKPA